MTRDDGCLGFMFNGMRQEQVKRRLPFSLFSSVEDNHEAETRE
jgi:hypothetical protein